jgi:hypothetical protein
MALAVAKRGHDVGHLKRVERAARALGAREEAASAARAELPRGDPGGGEGGGVQIGDRPCGRSVASVGRQAARVGAASTLEKRMAPVGAIQMRGRKLASYVWPKSSAAKSPAVPVPSLSKVSARDQFGLPPKGDYVQKRTAPIKSRPFWQQRGMGERCGRGLCDVS